MKRIIYCFSALLLILMACNSTPQKSEEQPASGEDDGIQVVRKPYRNSEQIEYEIPVVKGTQIKHGIQKRYYLHGSLYSTIPYVAGEKQGVAYTYYKASLEEEPQVWKEQPYENNVLHGVCKRYHQDGALQAEYEYKNGLRAVGLKEYRENGKEIKQPELIVTKYRVAQGYYIAAQLSDNNKNVDYFIGELVEGKYLPAKPKALQVRSGIGEIVLEQTSGKVTITAEYSTRYRNKGVVTASVNLP
ncbi:hypothetical protein SLH46_08665 [Draconibacterium sp. IB214405]|uniref:toxin-antitoxin system YwqK family antitoxin n=1 Tax=Draconibacterium sp. IB214405 TaxID=3097352 RepID=UPI002A138E82|nr:hypothetical protein [Draconibacterium sp. IB214405]MDX8339249.1 hypothetical protein [Draconibacterium sp. IB214405]